MTPEKRDFLSPTETITPLIAPSHPFLEKITAGLGRLDQWTERLGEWINQTSDTILRDTAEIADNPVLVAESAINLGKWIINHKFETAKYAIYAGGAADLGLVSLSITSGNLFSTVLFSISGIGIITAIDNMEKTPYDYGYRQPSVFDRKSSLVSGLAGAASLGLYLSGNPDLFYYGLGLATVSSAWGCIVTGSRRIPPWF